MQLPTVTCRASQTDTRMERGLSAARGQGRSADREQGIREYDRCCCPAAVRLMT